ncbi:MAG: VOC family protein [Porticoccaceae bacterium]|jgi:PhnB protein
MSTTATPYLGFDGNCREAFARYSAIFGGNADMVTHGESPACDQIPAEMHGCVMHAQLTTGDLLVMGADMPPGMYQKPTGICVAVAVDTPEEAERVFAALAEGGEVQMPMDETFWAHRFGMLIDRFAIPWMINCLKAEPELNT